MSNNIDRASIEKFLLDAYEPIQEVLNGDSIEDIASLVADLEYFKREVSELLEQSKTVLGDRMGSLPEMSTEHYVFEKKQGAQRKSWDHGALSSVVADRLVAMSIDLDTGEILKSPSQMIRDAFAFAGVSYWRVKELQKIGVNADSYCEVGEGKTNIIVRAKG